MEQNPAKETNPETEQMSKNEKKRLEKAKQK